MKRIGWELWLGIALLLSSLFFYCLHYAFFRDLHHILIYFVGDVAFVFVEVLLVTILIHRVLEHREKKTRLEKLNMVIGSFFSEVGTDFLKRLSLVDSDAKKLQSFFSQEGPSSSKQLTKVTSWLKANDHIIEKNAIQWEPLRDFFIRKREFMLKLLQNGNLLEHESFTDMLWAVFHLTEELSARHQFTDLPSSDLSHLREDTRRAYGRVGKEWLGYVKHLKKSYPYLFSLAIRTNPFNPNASPIVSGGA